MDSSVFLCAYKHQHWAFVLVVRYQRLIVNFLVLWLAMILSSLKYSMLEIGDEWVHKKLLLCREQHKTALKTLSSKITI